MARTRSQKQSIIEKLFKRDGFKCSICKYRIQEGPGSHYLLRSSIDHVVPTSKGGTNGLYNLALTHKVCNSLKSSEELTEELTQKCRERVRELERTVVKTCW